MYDWKCISNIKRQILPKVVPRENLALITNKLTGILTQLEISGLTSKTEALYLMKMAKQDSNK